MHRNRIIAGPRLRIALLLSLLSLAGCDDDAGLDAELDAVTIEEGRARLTFRNTGSQEISLYGCPSGPRTPYERWSGAAWVDGGVVNDSCIGDCDWVIAPGVDKLYDVPMPSGRFRFYLWIGRGEEGDLLVRSNAIDVL